MINKPASIINLQKPIASVEQYLFLLMIFAAGFFGYLMRSLDWFQSIPGDLGDARFNSIILEHFFQWITGQTPSLWSPRFFYPFEGVLSFSDNHFGSAWSYAFFRLFGLTREGAYSGWFVLGTLLNFWVTYGVLRKSGFSIASSGLSAFIFAFSLPVLAKEGHAQLVYRFAVPLAFFAFYQFLSLGRPRDFAQAIFWLAVQFYCSIYIGVFLAYFLFITAITLVSYSKLKTFRLWVQSWRKIHLFGWLLSFLICVLSVLAICWLLYQYKTLSAAYKFERSPQEILDLLPRLSSYLIADRSSLTSWIGAWIQDVPMRHEHQLFVGLGPVLLGCAGLYFVWFSRNTHQVVGRVLSLSLGMIFLCTLFAGGFSLYQYIILVPGLNSVRAVSRIILVLLLPWSIFVAIASDVLLQSKRPWIKRFVFAVLLVSVTAESVFYKPSHVPVKTWLERQIQLASLVIPPVPRDAILFVLPKAGDLQYNTELDAMILAQNLGVATLNGYSGNLPPNFDMLHPCNSFENRLNTFWRVGHPRSLDKDELRSRIRLIEQTPCSISPIVATDEVVDRFLAKDISLDVITKAEHGRVTATIRITNHGTKPLTSLMIKGPLRLSWRYVELDASGLSMNQPEWTFRKDLYFSIQKNETYTDLLNLDMPPKPGNYWLEITLVQEGVVWLHDIGMQVGRAVLRK